MQDFTFKVFVEMDKDQSGNISFQELSGFIKKIAEPIGMQYHTDKDVLDLLESIDVDKNKTLDL